MHKYIIITFLVFGLQTDWLSETKKLILKTDKNSVLINTKVVEDKNGKSITTEYGKSELKKIKVEFVHSSLIDIKLNYYNKNGFLLGEIITGKDVLLYKRKRLDNEPYATLIESRTYFKNKIEGINLIRNKEFKCK